MVVYRFRVALLCNLRDFGGGGRAPATQILGEQWRTQVSQVVGWNVRPYWLVNPETFRRLELDCYNAELGIAVEYQGRQHYDGSDPSIARRDAVKVQACINRGVALVVVPYWVNVEEFLEREFATLENSAS